MADRDLDKLLSLSVPSHELLKGGDAAKGGKRASLHKRVQPIVVGDYQAAASSSVGRVKRQQQIRASILAQEKKEATQRRCFSILCMLLLLALGATLVALVYFPTSRHAAFSAAKWLQGLFGL